MTNRPHGRKPVNIIAEQRMVTRQHIWVAIRNNPIFEISSIIVALDNQGYKTTDLTVKDYIYSLYKGGYLIKIEIPIRGSCKKVTYELVNNEGVEAPAVDRNGNSTKSHTATDNMWRSMKMLQTFNYKDLIASASTQNNPIQPSTAKTYIIRLQQAGYLICIQPSTQKPVPTPAKYRLLASKNTGPQAPQIQRTKQVFDPNLGIVVHAEITSEAS